MKTKSFITILLLATNIFTGFAQDKKTAKSTVKEATVFFRGAQLTHTASYLLSKGENEIFIEGLSSISDKNSLKIKTSNGVVVSAYEFSVDFLSENKQSNIVKKLQDSIDICTRKLDIVNTDIKVASNLLDILQKGINKNVDGSEKGLGIDELVKTMDYYNAKSKELQESQLNNNRKKRELEEAISKYTTQINQESIKNKKTSGVLRLNLSSPVAANCNFTISYYTQAASWVPYYDINVTSIDKPIKITTKSKVCQTTGVDWEKVTLTLSTGNPGNGKIAPLFSAWFLDYYRPIVNKKSEMLLQNAYSYNLDIKEKVLSIPEENEGIDNDKGISDFVTQMETDLNIVYNIDMPYTIPGNGKEQSIDMQVRETPAEYKYYCAPRLDTDTYLLAEISNWEQLNLLTGRANVTYDGTYIGETYIDSKSTNKKLSLTLGSDNRVIVKREKLQDYSATKFLGNDVKQTFTYKLTVKNNQNKPVRMVLKDQYPISAQKNIEVELLTKATTPWTANKEDVGVITWEEELQAGEIKEYQISYSVKYPKGSNLNL